MWDMLVWILRQHVIVHVHVGDDVGGWYGRDLEVMVGVAGGW